MIPLTVMIPVRSFHEGKTRLSSVLPADERRRLVQDMLDVVIHAALDSDVVNEVVLVSPDDAVLEFAHSLHPRVTGIRQPADQPGLIPAADLARRFAIGHGVSRLLILFGDLPTVTSEDIRGLCAETAPLVIATDWLGGGSNGMLLNLENPLTHEFNFAYGPGSRWLHEAEANRLGLESSTAVIGGVAYDLDTAEDFTALIASGRELPEWLQALPIQQQETIA